MKNLKTKILFGIPVFLFLSAISYLILTGLSSEKEIITGIVETNEIDISSKIPGRIETILVNEGDHVKKGQIIAVIKSPELEAKLEQARGAMNAAKAKLDMTKAGLRKEEKDAVSKIYQQTMDQFDLAEKSWNRFNKLYEEGVISEYEKDQAEFKLKYAREQMNAAKAKYDMAMTGARIEEIVAVESIYYQALNGFSEIQSYVNELNIVAPENGEINKIIADQGEVISAGYPMFSMIKPESQHVVIQLPESKLSAMKKGLIVKGVIPGLNYDCREFTLNYISVMADFATWKPTSQKDDFDLKTFEIHLNPNFDPKDLRPGMTVNISL